MEIRLDLVPYIYILGVLILDQHGDHAVLGCSSYSLEKPRPGTQWPLDCPEPHFSCPALHQVAHTCVETDGCGGFLRTRTDRPECGLCTMWTNGTANYNVTEGDSLYLVYSPLPYGMMAKRKDYC